MLKRISEARPQNNSKVNDIGCLGMDVGNASVSDLLLKITIFIASALHLACMSIQKFLYRLSHWEAWHYLAKYIPIAPVWLWYCLRSRSLWFFTASNPTLTFGGFEGESKKEMYDQLPPSSYPKTIYIKPSLLFNDAKQLAITYGFTYPFAVKPDVGMMGFMFRKINNESEFKAYHKRMHVDYIVQDYVDYPLEVSVFYYRYPNEQKGTITGFLKKEFPEVTGNGTSTLWQLIQQYPRVQLRIEEMRLKHETRLNDIIPAGQTYKLSHALNLSRGGKLVSLAQEKDERLLKVFDELSCYTKHFYYGRYDIKCASIEELKKGKYSILEFNGSGAEPHHIYGNGNSLLQAYKIVLQHWKVLYKISKYNNHNGTPYWKFRQGSKFLKAAKKHFKMLKQLDAETDV